MEKFKESNYYYSNGELYSKTKKILKIIGKENRLKVLLNGVVYNIPITDIEKIYNSSLSLKDYYQKKKGSTRTVFLPSDIYTKLKDNNILNPSSTLLIHKILTSDNISTSYLPKRFRSAKPIEISSKYKRMIGFNDTKGIQLLENMNIIQKIPYETIYLKKTQEVNFIRNHSIRYVAITNSTKFFPFKFEFTYEKAFAQKPYDKKRSEAYYRLFDYTNKEELIKYYHTIKNEFKQQINTKNSYIVIRKIASIKALINSIMEDKNYCFRNKTNGREEKLLNLIENKKNKCRNLFTTIGNLTSKDITCSQLRFLYIFLFNPDSSLFSTTSTFYKEQVKINRKSLNEEIILLKNNLSQPDFWKILMHKHAVKDKELLKTDMLLFLADAQYYKYNNKNQYFASDYPKISELICALNNANNKNKISKNKFIIELQKAEADFVLNKVSDILIRLNADFITLHDQWFYNKKDEILFERVLNWAFDKYFCGLTNNYTNK